MLVVVVAIMMMVVVVACMCMLVSAHSHLAGVSKVALPLKDMCGMQKVTAVAVIQWKQDRT